MSSTATLYLRLLRKIVRDSAWRLGGADEILLASGLSRGDASASHQQAGRERPVEGDASART